MFSKPKYFRSGSALELRVEACTSLPYYHINFGLISSPPPPSFPWAFTVSVVTWCQNGCFCNTLYLLSPKCVRCPKVFKQWYLILWCWWKASHLFHWWCYPGRCFWLAKIVKVQNLICFSERKKIQENSFMCQGRMIFKGSFPNLLEYCATPLACFTLFWVPTTGFYIGTVNRKTSISDDYQVQGL